MAACITVNWDCNPEIRDSVEPGDVVNRERAELFAQAAIQVLTGRQLANCPITVRPCLSRCAGSSRATFMGEPWMVPYIKGGRWYNSCGCQPFDCACKALDVIYLDGPVAEVVSVTIDGVLVPPAEYRIDNGNQLVRLGETEWPACQDFAAPTTAPGTMAVEYIKGAALDVLGEFVAGLLANDFLNACNGGECSLPAGVTSIARQGVQLEIGPNLFPGGRTGIDAVDLWVETWNPYKVKSASRIHSVDKVRPRQTTWSA
jgi:hypothetical protein